MLVLVVVSTRPANRAITYGTAIAMVAIVTLVVLGLVHAGNRAVEPDLAYWPWLVSAGIVAFVVLLGGRALAAFGDVLTMVILVVRLALAIACLPIVLVTVLFERKRPPPPREPRWKGVG